MMGYGIRNWGRNTCGTPMWLAHRRRYLNIHILQYVVWVACVRVVPVSVRCVGANLSHLI